MEDAREALSDPVLSADPSLPGYPAGPGHCGASTHGSMIRLDGGGPAGAAAVHRRVPGAPGGTDATPDRVVRGLRRSRSASAGPRHRPDPAVALTVPQAVILRLIGVPESEVPSTIAAARHLHDRTFPRSSLESAEEAFLARLRALVRRGPADDLTGRLVASGELTEDEAVVNLRLVVAASVQTTSSMIGPAVLTDPSRSVEDLLARLERGANGPAPSGGCRHVYRWRAGVRDGVVVSLPAANASRPPGGGHVAFGFGPYQCLGQHLARTELDEVLKSLFPLRPATRDLRMYDASVIYGVESLPVTW
ncbi:hypothetical protein GCM10022267_85910 [Lentzea roselyniae]|uniref:Cytochrome P450 n=1 Tax=Lentzea roselyniae TaxID=531940 RepID=A0ABP7CDU9_9PSEU